MTEQQQTANPRALEAAPRKHPCALCELCPLYRQPYVPAYDPRDHGLEIELTIVGEAPGVDESVQKRPFVGASGQLFDKVVRSVGRDPAKVYRTNTVACRPPGNREPDAVEVMACLPRLMAELEGVDQERVLVLGKTSSETVLQQFDRMDAVSMSVGERRGRWYSPGQDPAPGLAEKYVLHTWHPAYVLRKPSEMAQLRNDVAKGYGDPRNQAALIKEPKTIVLSTVDAVRKAFSLVPDGSDVAFDFETNQITWYDRPGRPAEAILLLSLCWDQDLSRGFVIGDELLYESEEVKQLIRDLFDRCYMIAQNGKFDVLHARAQLGIENARCDFDTMIAHFCIDETPGTHGLKEQAQERYGLHNYEKELVSPYLRSSGDEWSKVPFGRLARYSVWDTVVTLALKQDLEAELKAKNLYDWPFMNVLMVMQHGFTQMQRNGFGIDVDYVRRCQAFLHRELEQLETEMKAMVGMPDLNIRSSIQLKEVLFRKLRLPMPKIQRLKTKDPNGWSTSKEVLAKLDGMHPFTTLLARYRRIDKIRSSYIDNLVQFIDVNGRVHPDPKVIGTEVGRLAMADPAAQTIPRPSDFYGSMARGAFIASPATPVEIVDYNLEIGRIRLWPKPTPGEYGQGEKTRQDWLDELVPMLSGHLRSEAIRFYGLEIPKYVLIVADYSQAELRVAAALSGEPFLLRVYAEDRDLHDEGTLAMFGTPEQVGGKVIWKERRVMVKMFNFAYLYGGNENSFSQDAGLPLNQARDFVRRYEANMPVLAQWKREQLRKVKTRGFVASRFGRRRRFLLITPQNEDEARKACVHAPVAGTASDLTSLAACRLIEEGVEVCLVVHDSVLARERFDRAEATAARVVEVMVEMGDTYLPEVRWKADADILDRWARPPQSLTPRGIEYIPDLDTPVLDPVAAATTIRHVARVDPDVHDVPEWAAVEEALRAFEDKQTFGNKESIISSLDRFLRAVGGDDFYQSEDWQSMFVKDEETVL